MALPAVAVRIDIIPGCKTNSWHCADGASNITRGAVIHSAVEDGPMAFQQRHQRCHSRSKESLWMLRPVGWVDGKGVSFGPQAGATESSLAHCRLLTHHIPVHPLPRGAVMRLVSTKRNPFITIEEVFTIPDSSINLGRVHHAPGQHYLARSCHAGYRQGSKWRTRRRASGRAGHKACEGARLEGGKFDMLAYVSGNGAP
ncbi:hypothetical protein DFH27DRAFT_618574 [Peziza echinospora]|nr:hypothetical protein DFH27DRAFT_618574 [Peziza echinospora]